MKERLLHHGIDIRGCTERSELEALWGRYRSLCCTHLYKLQERCAATMEDRGRRLAAMGTVAECAAFLCTRGQRASSAPPASGEAVPRPAAACVSAAGPTGAGDARAPNEDAVRGRTAAAEIVRILRLRKEAYRSVCDWGFAVLNCGPLQHQRAFRELMRILHPDRIGDIPGASTALEMLKEARGCCERASSRVQPPLTPIRLTAKEICQEPGRRQILVEWGLHPGALGTEAGPVKRYIIHVFDPAYGRALKVAVLEPDYNEELRRFVPVEELRSYLLDEQNLQKMPTVFQQTTITVQVAAANDAGQSEWAVLRVPLRSARAKSPTNRDAARKASPAPGGPCNFGRGSPPRYSKATTPQAAVLKEKVLEFVQQLDENRGPGLQALLLRQSRALLSAVARSSNLPSDGSKEELADRIAKAYP